MRGGAELPRDPLVLLVAGNRECVRGIESVI